MTAFLSLSVRQRRALLIAILLAVGGLAWLFRPASHPLPRAAIGGGMYHNINNTNSLEALEANWASGFRTFAISLRWTQDNYLVCLSNWQEGASTVFPGYHLQGNIRMNYAEFTTHATVEGIHPCTIDTLFSWMEQHPEATVIAVVPPGRAAETAQLIKSKFPNYAERIIPQVISPEQYKDVIALGYKRAIFAMADPPHPPALGQLRDELLNLAPYAITIPASRAGNDDRLMLRLREANVPIYAVSVDDCAELKHLRERGVSEAYTNILTPQDCPL